MNHFKESCLMENWFAVYTQVRHEKKVSKEIENRDIETYLPLRQQTSYWKDRKKIVHLPLFPGYLFVKIRPEKRTDVLKVPGIVRILGVNGELTPVPEYQIEGIKELLESGLKYEIAKQYVSGREVEVTKGLLAGTEGKIIELRGHYKLILSVDIIKRSILVEVGIDQVDLL